MKLIKRSKILSLSKGFSLVELIVVISVIGILASVGVVSYANSRKQTTITQLTSDLKNAGAAMENARNFGESYPTTAEGVPYVPSPSTIITLLSSSMTAYCIRAESAGTKYYMTNTTAPSTNACT